MDSLYFDPKNSASFGGVSRLQHATGEKQKDVEEWLRGQRVYTLHKPARKKFNTRPYKAKGIDALWQADLAEFGNYETRNDGNNYVLTVIDVFSRYAWARPVKHKTGQLVSDAFENILKKGRIPTKLQTDQGKEFENSIFQAMLRKYNISFFTIKSQFKAALVERYNRTLKSRLWRYFTHVGNYRWLDVLQDFVDSYNASRHRMIGMAPKDVNRENEYELWEKQETTVGPQKVTWRNPSQRFKVGEYVRLSKAKQIFDKGYVPNYTEEIFSVSKVINTDPVQYKVKDWNGDEILGSFYAAELQKVNEPTKYMIEHIIRERTVNGQRQYLVKWLGYGSQFNSWVTDINM